jgi:NADP-dependent 3-hydroxy acid dehydrogenase YdfG
MDLTDRASITAAVAGLPEAFRPVDCLVNNGGLALGTRPVPEVSVDDWERMIDTNIKGLIYTTLEVLPLLRAAGRGAAIVNIGSVAWRWAYPGGNVYGGTKAFVHQFSQNLRADLAGSDVRVTAIEPGMAKTEFMLVRTHGDAGINESYYDGVEPLGGDDIADLVWFVATRPPHVNIGILEVTPVAQVPGAARIVRR